MRLEKWIVAVGLAASAAGSMLASGCGSSPPLCTPGESRACACTDGRMGAQTCRADGTLDVCTCGGGVDAGALDAFVPSDGAMDDAVASDASIEDAAMDDAAIDDASVDAGVDAGSPVDAATLTDAFSCATMGDRDGDGHRSIACGGDDCNDTNMAVHPGALDVCDGIDDDCNGTIDDEPLASSICGSGRHCSAGTCVTGVTTEQISIGDRAACARLSDGTVLCWGSDMYEQLGTAGMADSLTPVMVSSVTDAVDLSCGGYACCAVIADGSLVCWGLNNYQELGRMDVTFQAPTPVMIAGISGATRVVVASSHVCALASGGTIYCWGYGAPGVGTHIMPMEVSGGAGNTELASGYQTACVIGLDTSVRCWGSDAFGGLGDGISGAMTSTPRDVPSTAGASAVATSVNVGVCAIVGTQLVCWGENMYGTLGTPTLSTTAPSPPTAVAAVHAPVSLASAAESMCAVQATGEVLCWGWNHDGEAANGTHTDVFVPTVVAGLPHADRVWGGVAGRSFCARTVSGIYCWGDDTYGQLGDGVPGTVDVHPVPVPMLP